jgi:hypothetical protein
VSQQEIDARGNLWLLDYATDAELVEAAAERVKEGWEIWLLGVSEATGLPGGVLTRRKSANPVELFGEGGV